MRARLVVLLATVLDLPDRLTDSLTARHARTTRRHLERHPHP